MKTVLAALLLTCSTMACAQDGPVPVFAGAPSCSFVKVGTVNIEEGRRFTEATSQPALLVPVRYATAFERLSTRAAALGANAVILRRHTATFSDRVKRKPRPLHVALSGLAIRLENPGACSHPVADPAHYEQRALSGDKVNVPSDQAYLD